MNDMAIVRLTLTSEIDGDRQEHHLQGEWFRKGRAVYVRYTENDENAGEVRTVVRWKNGELHVTRRGIVESEQTFVVGNRRTGKYVSPFARFQMVTDTSLLWMQCGDWKQKSEVQQEEGTDDNPVPVLPMLLEWHYKMYVDDELTGQFKIKLKAEKGAN